MSSSSKDTALMSTEEYFNFLEIPFEKIKSATNNFAHENLLTQGSSFEVYKGQLLQSRDLINIVARKSLLNSPAFNEFVILKYIKHKNIVPIFKVTQTKDNTDIFINKHEANGSLDKHLSDPTLTWLQRLHICVKVALALKYLHYDAQDDHYFIHGNIKSSKILLDHNWEPKLNGFGFAAKARKHHLHLTSKYNGRVEYMDPAYEDTKGLTHKSDVFSFGVLLAEVLFGREAFIQNNDNWYFARLARSHYEERKLDDLIDPDLRKQMNLQSFNIFSETVYYCLKEQRSQRPDINQVLSKLEKALELQHKHEHPTTVAVKSTSSNHLKGKISNHLKFRLSDIKMATNNFSEECCIGSGGYGKVYRAELEHFNGINSLVVEGKNKGVLPNQNSTSTVAIKRISSRVDGQGEQGFFAEIEMLSKCRHPNIVSLLGFCDEGSEMILVYEYVTNGSLEDYLGNSDNMTNLTWAQRIQICLDIAHGLNYLHTSTEDKHSIIHRDIKSANILLDDNWVAKIADFGLSKLHHASQQRSTLVTNHIAGTELYLDPEYLSTGKLKTKSDVYSFGVVLFEMMCGKLAHDKTYNERGLPSIARECFNQGTLKNMVDPKIKEADEGISMLKGGVNQYSLDTFSKIAYQCLAETQSDRPTMDVVINELVKALNFQKTSKGNLAISIKALKLGTQNFSNYNSIGEGRFWKLYKGEVAHANGSTPILAKRWERKSRQGHMQFLNELDFLFENKHKNIIALVGYCTEMDENIIVYEHASKGSLDKLLCDPSVTWMNRLKICIGVADGLKFLHSDGVEHEDGLIHRDIKSGSILLDGDWNAKIFNFELSVNRRFISGADDLDDNDCNSLGYVDPVYQVTGFLSDHSDIYSLGVILIEMLCGRLAWVEGCEYHSQSLGPLAVRHYKQNRNLDEMIFEGIKEQIVPKSLTKFVYIALECLEYGWGDRPTASDVVKQLNEALELQEDYEIWEPRLPVEYKEIIQMSNYSNSFLENKKDLYDMFCNGILLQDSKVLFSLGINGERTEIISAKKFLYKNCTSHKWRSVKESRFPKVLKMLDSSNLNIQIKIKTQFLSPSVHYKVLLIFRFCGPRKYQTKRMYVNLKYKMGNESLCAYFATWREDGWMMIELFQFLNHTKDTDFEVLLESFSRCYCGRDSVYIEGIQFQPIHNYVTNEENEKFKEAQRVFETKLKTDKVKNEEIEKSTEAQRVFQTILKIDKENLMKILQFSLKDIELATDNFSKKNCVGSGRYGEAYIGKIPHANANATIVAKRWDSEFDDEFQTELDILSKIKHRNMIGLVGYCNEKNGKILVYEHMSKGSLDKYLKDSDLKWMERLRICIDVASALEFLHGGDATLMIAVHRNIKSNGVLLSDNWDAKISNFELSSDSLHQDVGHLIYDDYLDPQYIQGFLTEESDIYSLGVLLFEILCGRLLWATYYYEEGRLDKEVFAGIKDQIVPQSLTTFVDIAYQCLHEDGYRRPEASDVVIQLKKALEFQVNNEANEKSKEVQQVFKSISKTDKFSPSKMKLQKFKMFSAKTVVYESSDVAIQSRFIGAIQFLREHVFRIRCKIKSELLSSTKENVCYLVFKLSNKFCGLHGPVIVRDLFHWKTKETRILYFRSPNPLNLHDTDWIPKERNDGWMEVVIWKFNSNYKLKYDQLFVRLKLVTYEGTMAGLIVRNIEFR